MSNVYVFKIPMQLGKTGENTNAFIDEASKYESRYANIKHLTPMIFIPSDIDVEKFAEDVLICRVDQTNQASIDSMFRPYIERVLPDFKIIFFYKNLPGSSYPELYRI